MLLIPEYMDDNDIALKARQAIYDGDRVEFRKTYSALKQVDCRDKDGNTLLHHAAWCGEDEMVKYILDDAREKNISLANAVNHEGQTPLHMAAKAHKGRPLHVIY